MGGTQSVLFGLPHKHLLVLGKGHCLSVYLGQVGGQQDFANIMEQPCQEGRISSGILLPATGLGNLLGCHADSQAVLGQGVYRQPAHLGSLELLKDA